MGKNSKPLLLEQQNNVLSHRRTNWQAEEEVDLSYIPTRPDAWLMDGVTFEEAQPYLVTQPGKPEPPRLWMPPCIEKVGVMYVGLSALAEYLTDGNSKETAHWDAKTFHGTLTVGQTTLTFTLKKPNVVVKGGKPLTLPYVPFLSKPVLNVIDEAQSDLYIPLKPLVNYFGGTMHLDPNTRQVELEITH